ncbi:potassium-transporting ATPase subunit KdpC [Promicromonospora iranensis]|uniref:Potassium-transporting ATPase KdpC subunit n=1 Tax=Promicromonospora iranensis TaxID=1105144 RepID=A0ABU2CLM4_9MICO|nr:potassium-transporting ATPase subunit KdpC [Promicromonospora iranensis]MDR7382237.1 K+-transporting ATPase ATPase C chain [Promicromonospora iranensis]
MAPTTAASDLATLTRHSLAGLRMLLAFTFVTGLAYPLAMTAVGQVAFPWQANGSLVRSDGGPTTSRSDAVGSALVAQGFTGAEYFHPRPSAGEHDTLASGGSNLGPLNPGLVASIEGRKAAVAAAEGVAAADVPPDAVTASASGLDPHISPAYAAIQVARVARERGLSDTDVADLVARHTAGRDLGVLGEPRVNVLELNLALDVADLRP